MRGSLLVALAGLLGGASESQIPLGPPISLSSADIVSEPSDAVAAGVLDLAGEPLTAKKQFDFVCMASAGGSIFDCLSDAALLPPGASWLDFTRIAKVDDKKVPDHSLSGLARLQARRTVLRARPDGPETYLVRLTETLDPRRKTVLEEPSAVLTRRDVKFASMPEPALVLRLYPIAALRDGAQAVVNVSCRVRQDYSLFCHKGSAIGPVRPGDAEDFVFAAYQFWSMARLEPKAVDGRDTVGADVDLSINWRLGD